MQDPIDPEMDIAGGEPPAGGAPSFDTTIVICVEAGGLEQQAILLVQSIRNWGGRFATAPIFAVQPRIGPALDARTLAFFRQARVEFVKRSTPRYATWKSLMNKSKALAHVEKIAATEIITWIDTDILVVAEPDKLALSPGEDFAALPSPDSYHSTTGPGDHNEAYWQAVCDLVGIDIETMGWVTVLPENHRIRSFWQSGVYSYRRSSELGRIHCEAYRRLMEARIAHNTSGIFHNDQTSLALAVRLAGLRSRGIPVDHNLCVNPLDKPHSVPAEQIAAAKVIHYHGFMWPDEFPRFLRELQPLREEVRHLLEKNGPIELRRMAFHRRLVVAALRRYYKFRYRRFERSCRVL